MKYQVTTIGDAMKDIFVFPEASEMEKPIQKDQEKFLTFGYGDKITISDIRYDVGGSACNVAMGLAKLGIKSAIITTLGKDPEGEDIRKILEKNNVSDKYIKINKEKKTSFSVIISFKGERSILVFHSFRPEDFVLPENIDTDWLYVGPLGDGYKSLYSKIISLASEKNINIALNPGSVQINDGLTSFGGLLNVCKILLVNKEEGKELVNIWGVPSVKEIMEALKKTGPEIVVLTDGKEGAYAMTDDEFFKVGAYPAERLETTGAGDAFSAAFLAGRIKGVDLYKCLKLGVTNSASVIEKYGAHDGQLSFTTLKRRIAEYRWPEGSLRFS